MTTATGTWFTEMEDRFGVKMFDAKAHRWERILNDPESEGGYNAKTNARELREMVLWLEKAKGGDGVKDLTARKLFGLLLWYRKSKRDERDGAAPDERAGMIARQKSAMRNARGDTDADLHLARWNILCDPRNYVDARCPIPTYNECMDLERWAYSEGLLPSGYRPAFDWKTCREATTGAWMP